jgi:hypothetical protein
LLSAFSFDSKGAKEKATKKKTPKGEFRSCASDRRFAGGTRQTFEKV